ncbi:PREDICTED: cancer/testis antigen 47A-like, partial [Galeopterus variegatus]|uniref:Cancer/testis antigen 47A-like n=1 Tax=Galeopterus variegatus TaxID=482537 RepID=A0ABM0SDN4_GALVR
PSTDGLSSATATSVATILAAQVEVLPSVMSATGDGDPSHGGPDSSMSLEGAWAGAAGAGEAVGHDFGLDGGATAPAATPARVTGVAGVAGAMGGLSEEEGEQAGALAVILEGESSSEITEDSDFGPVPEEDQAERSNLVVDAHQFPMAGFRLLFLDLVQSLLHRIYYNDYILVRPRRGRVNFRRRPRARAAVAEPPMPPGPERPGLRAASHEGGSQVIASFLGPSVSTIQAARETTEEVEGFEATEYEFEYCDEEARVAGREEEQEAEEQKENENTEEGPEQDQDPAEGRSGASS